VTDIGGQIYVDRARRRFFQEQLETDGFIRSFEAQFQRRDGSRIWVMTNARAVRNALGTIQYYEGSNFEITEKKRAEDALRESEERVRKSEAFYSSLVENLPQYIFRKDLE